MAYECEHCGKVFNTNAGLYTHKEKYHKAPTVVLVNHDEHKPSTSVEYPVTPRSTHTDTPSSDDDLEISFDEPQPSRKRKVIDVDDSDVGDGDNDDVWRIKKRKYDVIPNPATPRNNTNDGYKKMYFKCLKQSKKLQSEHKKFKQKYEKVKRDCEDEILQYRERLEKINEEHRNYTNGIEEECRKKLETINDEHRKYSIGIEEEYQKRLQALESDCENKIKDLNEYITDLKNNEYANFNSLSKIIFNCVTIEEIFKIRNLIHTQQIGELLNNHMKTLQNIMLGLTVGVIPICNPQRTSITDEQRALVEYIQNAPASAAKRKIQHNRARFSNLWSIVDDSLKLVCETYNRYGSHDESG